MGNGNSKQQTGGMLQGAYTPPLPGVSLPTPLNRGKEYNVTVPLHKKGGMTMIVAINGEEREIRIPEGLRPKDKFRYRTKPDVDQVFSSTLPTLPGYEIVQSKPIIWGTVAQSDFLGSQAIGKVIGDMLQDAQFQIRDQAVLAGCNAVLGITHNVINENLGGSATRHHIIVTCCGTPCIVVPSSQQVAVNADVIVEPLYP